MRPAPLTAKALILVALTALLALPAAAIAQGESPADLRRENDALRNRLAQAQAQADKLVGENDDLRNRLAKIESILASLQSEARALRKDKKDLEDQIRALGLHPVTGPAPQTPQTPAPAQDAAPQPPDNPFASVPSLLAALTADYDEALAGADLQANRADYIREVRRWARNIEREMRSRVQWVIEIDPQTLPGDDNLPVSFRVVDPDSLQPLHLEQSTAVLGSRFTRRLRSSQDTRYWNIDAMLMARPVVNADRQDAGPTNYPPLIGPFAEFGFDLSIRSLVPNDDAP